jgi:PAS domain S-box-containing protein
MVANARLNSIILRHIIDAADEAILLIDAETLTVIDANRWACKLLNYEIEDIYDKPLTSIECSLSDVFFWEDLKQEPQFDLIRTAQTEWMRSDGSVFYVEKKLSCVTEGNKTFWILYAHDLTQDRHTEQQQTHLISQLQSALESTAEGILSVDLDGNVIYLNQRFATMWQVPDAILIERKQSSMLAWVTSCLLESELFSSNLMKMQQQWHGETDDVLALRDGRFVAWVSKPEFLRDSLVGRVFSVRDISAMKKIETDLLEVGLEKSRMLDALSISESRLRRLVNSNLVGIIQGDLEGNLSEANDVLLKLIGISLEQFKAHGLNWYQVATAKYHHEFKYALKELVQYGHAQVFEAELLFESENKVPVRVGLAPLEGSKDEWVGFVQDLTEQRKADQVKADFIAMVSHELRTPLTSIRGALGLLENGVAGILDEKVVSLIAIAHKNSQRLGTLVNDLLDMEKLASGKMNINIDRIDIIRLCEQAIEANFSYAHSLEVSLHFESHPAQAWGMGDADRVMQVFANLISNAAKFSHAGGVVDIRVLPPNESTYRIEIEDHGTGIPLEFQKNVFSKFAQADGGNTRQQGGTGLGLNITKTLVERMGGEVGFESEVGVGTKFWFTIIAAVQRKSD